jgi:hypothetical protein
VRNKGKLGGFDSMWKMLEKEAEKKPQDTQNKAKIAYQFDLASDIIDRKHSHLNGSNTLSSTIQREDLIQHKI